MALCFLCQVNQAAPRSTACDTCRAPEGIVRQWRRVARQRVGTPHYAAVSEFDDVLLRQGEHIERAVTEARKPGGDATLRFVREVLPGGTFWTVTEQVTVDLALERLRSAFNVRSDRLPRR